MTSEDTAHEALAAHIGIDAARVTLTSDGIDTLIAIDGEPPDGEHAAAILSFWDGPVYAAIVADGDDLGGYGPIAGGASLPPPVDDEELYWTAMPPEPSPRFVEWKRRIEAGWRPCPEVRALGYHAGAIWFGVYIAEHGAIVELLSRAARRA